MNQTLLMSDADYFAMDAPINPYYGHDAINVDVAKTEHAAIRAAFELAGAKIIKIDPPSTSQDGVYTANWALARGDRAVLARLPGARKSEENYAENVLRKLGKDVIRVPENWRFSGQGDALPCGEFLLCGSNYRSDVAAQEFAAKTLGFTRIQLQTVPQIANGKPVINAASGWPDSFFYDIDLAISVLRNDLIAFCPDAFTADSVAKIRELPMDKIEVSLDEATKGFACNLVSTGETVVMSANAPELQAEIEKRGLRTITPEIHELSKGGGYIRCVSLCLD